MKYIKSSGGYYYKELSNGKRSRVSAEEYNTKKQKFMSKQGGTNFVDEPHPYDTTLTPQEQKKYDIKKVKEEKIDELIGEFETNRPKKGKIGFSTRKKLYEVMDEIIEKGKKQNIEKDDLLEQMSIKMKRTILRHMQP